MTDSLQDALSNLVMFRSLSPDLKQLVADSFTAQSFSFGSNVVSEGEEATAFYIIAAGRAQVIKRGLQDEEIVLNVLHPGDNFGKRALLETTKRQAAVRAISDLELFKLDRHVFQALIRQHPELRVHIDLQIKHRSLSDFFRLYTPFAKLPVAALTTLLQGLESVTVKSGDLVIRQGDPSGALYIVEEGHLRAFIEKEGQRHYRRDLRKGDFFGEVSLFQNSPRTASVEAVSDCRLLKLTPETFRELVNSYADFKEQIAFRIAQYDYKQHANVPEDFDEELLPANVAGEEEVGPYQADQKVDQRGKLGPFATADERFVKGGKRLRQFPHVFQVDLTDSGAACLAMICRHFDLNVSLGRIRQIVHTGPKGSNLRSLCRGAEEVGLAARSVQTTLEFLSSMPLPAIVHTTGNQWMVLYDVEGKWVSVADPSQGLRRISRAAFATEWSGYAILFDYVGEIARPRPETETPRRHKIGFRWMWPLFRPLAGSLLKALVLAIVISAMEMLRPIFSQIIVDRVLVGQDRDLLRVIIILMAGVLVFNLMAIAVQRYLLAFVAVRFDASTLDYITRRLLALPMTYFNTRRVGDIQRRLLGMKQVREFLVSSASSSLANATQLTASLVLMFIYSSRLAFIFVALVPIYVLMMRISQKRLRPIFNELEGAQGAYQSHQIEAIKGIETIKSLSAESTLRTLMLNQFHALSRQQFKAYLTSMYYDGAVSATIYVSLMLFLAVGAVEVLEGRMTVGALMAFNFLIALANGPIKELLRIWDGYQTVSVLLNRLDDIFDEEPEQGHDHARLVPVKRLEGAVSLKNVGFQYGGAESPKILDDITFEIPAGRMVAVVGRSGSGKTTLIKCLAGLLEPTAGNIFFDGMELKTLNYRDLRRQIGFVLQDNYLFNDTIARNIGFGDDEPDMDRVIWAARSANVHQFAERLPSGYETRVGESGLTLSGGQKQRIAIARALYVQPPILIFDEATSALDTESENVIKENLEKLMQGRTRFVIAHRLQTIREADVILVLEKGRLVEIGNHDELMRQQGIYYYLSSQQLGFE
jgi:ATP-binding cassette subfamily B protein